MMNKSEVGKTIMFDFRLWDSDDETLIPLFLDVFKAAFPSPQVSTKEIFLWKHTANPLGPSYIPYAVDVEGGRIASVRPFGPTKLVHNGIIYPSFEPLDTATHPDFGKMGLFTKLTRMCIDEGERRGCLFFTNNPNFNSRPGYLKLGSRDVGGIEILVKPLNITRIGWTYLIKRSSIRGVAQHNLNDNPQRLKQQLPADIQELLDLRMKWRNVWAGYRTPEMLKYRLLSHPFHPYEVVDFKEGIAFLHRVSRGPLTEGKLVEVFFRVEERSIGPAIKSMIRHIRDRYHLDMLSVVFTVGHPYYEAFRAAGFYKAPSNISFYLYTFSHCPPDLADKPWALTGADIDTQ